ncbi:MAG: hypothetical protein KKB81_06640 [Candidatus Margulisbacteria bacterium]|nr:hypothetical protein [Candidatus Margulisiibacteriota bacterium]MBU1022474.1 hypothetical protein [Candidatus Margulisiibacteriota bacterium]MBU1728458.1 hypothetical protein [Candidatus Margulisiibacteriota bacterium]MBU1954605.1 hypothetical protein [Candidatus Margulisiibacteriota bacterium]
MIIRKITILIMMVLVAGIIFTSLPDASFAQEKYMTKGEAIAYISATDFVKQKIGALLSWTVGYDISKVNRARLVPIINYIVAVPRKAPPDGRTIVELQASVDDPGGLPNISGVRADLSGIGKLPNMMLVDNGLWGDAKAGDGIYTMQTNISRAVSLGEKEVAVAVANRKGWVALGKTNLLVLKTPKIVTVKATPSSVVADGTKTVLIEVELEGKEKDREVKRVFVNLQELELGKLVLLRNDGKEGDRVADDNVFIVKVLIPAGLSPKTAEIPVYVENFSGGAGVAKLKIKIVPK